MLVYQVNLEINLDIFDAYYQWLLPHVQEMLSFKGFIKAEVLQDEEAKNKLSIIYHVQTRADLDNYLQNHSHAMRDDGIKRFGKKFTANRSIFAVIKSN